jgi:hypothetical protein
MLTFLPTYLKIVSFLLLLALLGVIIFASEAAPIVSGVILSAGLVVALFFIVHGNRKALLQGRVSRLQFVRNILLEVLGFLLVLAAASYLGGLAGKIAGENFGVLAGLFAAILTSLMVGYGFRWGYQEIYRIKNKMTR